MNKLKRHRLIAIPLLIMLFIWFFSATPGSISNSQSLPIAHALQLPHLLTRKLAHICVYFALGIAWFIYFRSILPKSRLLSAIAFAFIASFLAASLDEFHQLFVPNRSGLLSDVFIDSFAATLGIFIATSILLISQHKHTKQHKHQTPIQDQAPPNSPQDSTPPKLSSTNRLTSEQRKAHSLSPESASKSKQPISLNQKPPSAP